MVTQEHGKSLEEARGSVARGVEHLEVACGMPSLMMGYNLEDGAAPGIDEEMIRQPMGVFACIAPFNFPAMVPFWFWPYAIAAGNTFIVKPSEQDPITQMLIFELLEEVGLPAGVMNMVNGDKEVVDAMLHHPLIKGISFVGSTRVGHYVYHEGAKHKKRVQAQAGAKNHLVVMPDAVLDKAAQNWINSFFGCAGERCLAGSVLVCVGDETHATAAARRSRPRPRRSPWATASTSAWPWARSSRKSAKERILGLIETGIAEGATLLLDGRDPDVVTPGCEGGYFVGPTIFDNVTPGHDHRPGGDLRAGGVHHEGRHPRRGAEDHRREPLRQRRLHLHPGRLHRPQVQVRGERRQHRHQHRRAGGRWPTSPSRGRKDSFFGDLHGQGRDAIDFFTDKKVVVNRWIWDPKTMGTWS